MAKQALKTSAHPLPSPHATPAVEEMVAQVVSFAREARYEDQPGETTTHVLPDFKRILQVSGRFLLISDIVALIAAFTCGGLIAWATNSYLFKAGFQPLFDLLSLQQFALFAFLGISALLWLDTKGHYRQRLPYWETTGHIVLVAFFGFVSAGFVYFAAKYSASSRLWMGLSWVLFAVFLFGGRTMVRRVLDSHGQWKIPAVIVGTGPTSQAAMQALGREHEM
jgi:hypothetical protein